VAEARANGYTVTAFGRRRPLPDLLSGSHQARQAAERQAMNAGIQGLAADLFKAVAADAKVAGSIMGPRSIVGQRADVRAISVLGADAVVSSGTLVDGERVAG